MLGLAENLLPNPVVTETYAIMDNDIESVVQSETEVLSPGLYGRLKNEAYATFGSGKPLVARYVATGLVAANVIPWWNPKKISRRCHQRVHSLNPCIVSIPSAPHIKSVVSRQF
jgi:hypothetical protein